MQVAPCYPKETADFPSHLSSLLLENYGTLSPDTRKTLVQNLVMLRNKNVITSIESVAHLAHHRLRVLISSKAAQDPLPASPSHHIFIAPYLHPQDHSVGHPHREHAYEEP
jgi:hypothetical protein